MKKFWLVFSANFVIYGLIMIFFEFMDSTPIDWIKLGVQTLIFSLITSLIFIRYNTKFKR